MSNTIILFIYFQLNLYSNSNCQVSFLNAVEEKIVLLLAETFGIRHCIFVKDDLINLEIVKNVKHLSSKKISGLFLDYYEMVDSVWDKMYTESMVILKEDSISHNIGPFFKYLNRKSISHKMKWYIWIVFVENSHSLYEESRNMMLPCDSEVIVIHGNNGTFCKLTEVYGIRNQLFVYEYGTWDNRNGLKAANILFQSRRLNLNGFPIGMVREDRVRVGNTSDIRNEITRELIQDLANAMNSSVKVVWLTAKDLNGPWEKEGEVFGNALPLSSDYPSNYKFGPIFKVIMNWYIRVPVSTAESDYYIQPFELDIWKSIILFIIVGSVVIVFIQNIFQNIVDKTQALHVTEYVFVGFESFCNQIGGEEFKNNSFRVACISFRFLALFIIPSYSAFITSFIAIRTPQEPFRNLDGFFKHDKYKLATEHSSFFNRFIEYSTDSTAKRLREHYSITFHKENQDAERICHEKIAFADFDNDIYLKNLSCDVFRIEQPLSFTLTGLLFNSKMHRTFVQGFLPFYSSGVINRFRNIINKHGLPNDRKDGLETFVPVEVGQMVQVLSIVLIGVLLAVVICISEVVYKNVFKK